MTLTEVFEHTCDLSLLPEKALILDIGCLGFEFADYFRQRGHEVFAVDIQQFDGDYERIAITGYNGTACIEEFEDKQATRLSSYSNSNTIPCCTLETFTKIKIGDRMWDLIKCDSEGSEYPMIMSLTKPPATQFSVEMHLHTGIYGMDEVREMEEKLYSLGYKAVRHELTEQHGAGLNYWSSLFLLDS